MAAVGHDGGPRGSPGTGEWQQARNQAATAPQMVTTTLLQVAGCGRGVDETCLAVEGRSPAATLIAGCGRRDDETCIAVVGSPPKGPTADTLLAGCGTRRSR